jgi:hypothetical protein
MAVQYSGSHLSGSISRYYFKTPIFKITLSGVLLVAVSSFTTFAALDILPEAGQHIVLSVVLTSGTLMFFLILIYVLLMPELITIEGILRYYGTGKPNTKKINNICAVIKESVEKNKFRVAKQAIQSLQSISSNLVSKTDEHTYGSALIYLKQILISEVPDLVQRSIDDGKDELHSEYQSVYVDIIDRGSRYNFTDAISLSNRGLERILSMYHMKYEKDYSWQMYINAYKIFSRRLPHVQRDPVPVAYLVSVVEHQRLLYKNTNINSFSSDFYITSISNMLKTYENVYRHIIFKYDSRALSPPTDREFVQSGTEVTEPDIDDLQQSFVASLDLCYRQLSKNDTDEEKRFLTAIPNVLSVICTTACSKWELDHSLPMIGLYLETAYLFSAGTISDDAPWKNKFNNIVSFAQSELGDDEYLTDEIIHWYIEENNREGVFFDFDEKGGVSDQGFMDWIVEFLNSDEQSSGRTRVN